MYSVVPCPDGLTIEILPSRASTRSVRPIEGIGERLGSDVVGGRRSDGQAPRSIRQVLNSGAAGHVAKHASETDLLDAIRRVAAGSRYVDLVLYALAKGLIGPTSPVSAACPPGARPDRGRRR